MLKKLQIWKRGPSLTTLSSLWITIVDVEENKYRIFCGLIQTCLMLVIVMICYWFLKGEVDTWANYGSPQWEVKLPLTVDQSPSHYFHHDNVFFFKGDWMFGVGLDICCTLPFKGDAGHFHYLKNTKSQMIFIPSPMESWPTSSHSSPTLSWPRFLCLVSSRTVLPLASLNTTLR